MNPCPLGMIKVSMVFCTESCGRCNEEGFKRHMSRKAISGRGKSGRSSVKQAEKRRKVSSLYVVGSA